ncbi:hypothetical protein PHJA_000679500 [Phtheirospermum japonicum]|uniref:Uncharacterized protein n=1 Tax=Phtheirospermum japonicum TaxID=374723 RepID=A0A830BJV5_9LAMI|nr:hypothetical protein PHJA_000679500 [Phtheirospermum japonicum]
MKCLQNPSLISRFFSFQVYTFWKWGALIFAILATFSSIIRRIKLVLIRFHTVKPSLIRNEEIIEFSEDDDDDDDDISLASSDDDDEQEERENSPTTSFRGQPRVDQDFCVKGWPTGHLRQRRRRSFGGAWSEFAPGKSVVKLWDSLGLSFDFDEDLFNCSSQSVVSTWDYDRDSRKNEFPGGIWNIPAAPATVVMTAEGNRKGGGVVLGGYDTRMRRRVPAFYAEWRSPEAVEKVSTGVSAGGVGKVYVRDGVSGVLTVGDVRNVRRPLESVRESDGETWWDADAVIVEDEI